MLTAAIIENNKTIGLSIFSSLEEMKSAGANYEIYDKEIHPWGPKGFIDIENGIGWKERLKEKLGYCIFSGDGLEETIIT
jgi:hypothetical protein